MSSFFRPLIVRSRKGANILLKRFDVGLEKPRKFTDGFHLKNIFKDWKNIFAQIDGFLSKEAEKSE